MNSHIKEISLISLDEQSLHLKQALHKNITIHTTAAKSAGNHRHHCHAPKDWKKPFSCLFLR